MNCMCVYLLWVSVVAITGALTRFGKKGPSRHLTLSWGALTWQSRGTLYLALLWITLTWHSDLTRLHTWHICRTRLLDTFAGHPHVTIRWDALLDTFVGDSYLARLLDTFGTRLLDTPTARSYSTFFCRHSSSCFWATIVWDTHTWHSCWALSVGTLPWHICGIRLLDLLDALYWTLL